MTLSEAVLVPKFEVSGELKKAAYSKEPQKGGPLNFLFVSAEQKGHSGTFSKLFVYLRQEKGRCTFNTHTHINFLKRQLAPGQPAG